MRFLVVLLIVIYLIAWVSSKITDEQYAIMPELFHLDNFDNCMQLGDAALYCTFTYELQPTNPNNTTHIWDTIQKVSSNDANYRHDHLRHGVCVPKTCPSSDPKPLSPKDPRLRDILTRCYDRKYKDIGVNGTITEMFCQSNESPYTIDSYDIGVAVVLIGYVVLVLVASFYEGVARYKSKEEYEKIIQTRWGKLASAFSIPRNWHRLKYVNTNDPNVVSLRCIQGIRFYNMICVIWYHTVLVHLFVPVSNTVFAETMTEKFTTVFLGNGGYVVQTFFMISYWLLTSQMFKMYEGRKEMPLKELLLIFVKRYIRLTPLLAVVVAIQSTWIVHALRGPMWDMVVGQEYRNCRANWWTNLLYINTYVDRYNMCMPTTWYVAVDTFYYGLGLIMIWLMWNYKKKIPLILGTLVVLSISTLGALLYFNDINPIPKPTPEDIYNLSIVKRSDWHELIGSVWGNSAGPIAGLTYGYIYYKYRNQKFLTSKFRLTLWWIVTCSSVLGILIVPGLIMFSDSYQHNVVYGAALGSVNRLIFAFAIGLAILGMSEGEGFMMKWTCEWTPTYVLGRLTYSAYLVHFSFLRINSGSVRALMYMSDYSTFTDLISDITASYIAAFFLTLLFELPISELQKHFIPQKLALNECATSKAQKATKPLANGDVDKKQI